MWMKLIPVLRCPQCREPVNASAFDESKSAFAAHDAWIETGTLTCRDCGTWHPIVRGVPVLLPYATRMHEDFARTHAAALASHAAGCKPPTGTPALGEELVMRSFSTEWLQYDFDGVIWEMDYQDHERRFLQEMGSYAPSKGNPGRFLEVGCGLGITTRMAQENFGGEAIGVDLSLAAWRAGHMNRHNPSLHFVQASVFALPFEAETFDAIYTRGVLHHTFSTREAFRKLATLCRPAGSLYVWVYGPKSINDNMFRRAAYAFEVILRFVFNRSPHWLSTAALAPMALGYLAFNRVRHWKNRRIQPYNFTRALHAARDRYTPEFAHRHSSQEVCGWFQEAGFTNPEVVDWRTMPSADHDDYRRNTGVRGRRDRSSSRVAGPSVQYRQRERSSVEERTLTR
jgi:ubiquinone/menaquinone biosynthesis C-methylase UbiE/uncharacterized protein YbaR (Trm112 family)